MIASQLPSHRRLAGIVAPLVIAMAVMLAAPVFLDSYNILQMTVFVAMALFALSQGFVWGYAGIMSFGQAAFFGLGGYAYSIAALYFGTSGPAIFAALAVPTLFAGLLGYFMFYGRISDAYVGVITLTVTVILFELINATSGDQYAIGGIAIGGFNGIPSVPAYNLPGRTETLDPTGMWYAAMGLLTSVYVILRSLIASRFGRVILAIRENETRAQLLGYDPNLYKLLAFMIAAAVAGLAGSLFAAWGGFISPTVFSLKMSAQVIVFVLVGGLGTLAGPILGAVFIQWLINMAGTQSALDASLVLGLVLVTFVLAVPKGIVPVVRGFYSRLVRDRSVSPRETESAQPAELAREVQS